jgi:hypothetical protein
MEINNAHLNKETESGEHSPKIAGHDTRQHGGQLVPRPDIAKHLSKMADAIKHMEPED